MYAATDRSQLKSRAMASRIIALHSGWRGNRSNARKAACSSAIGIVGIEQEPGHAVFDRVGQPADAPGDRESSRTAARASA